MCLRTFCSSSCWFSEIWCTNMKHQSGLRHNSDYFKSPDSGEVDRPSVSSPGTSCLLLVRRETRTGNSSLERGKSWTGSENISDQFEFSAIFSFCSPVNCRCSINHCTAITVTN